MQTDESSDPEPASRLACMLRRLRVRARRSPESLAKAIGVAATTIYRWESGEEYPSLERLNDALTTLNARTEERIAVVSMLPRARSIQALRSEAHKSVVSELADWMPGPGSLIEAMRRRKGVLGERVAGELGVTPSTFSRWETGRVVVPDHRLDQLCNVLGASIEERAVLCSSGALLGVQWDEPDDAGRCENRLRELAKLIQAPPASVPLDLMFLCLESNLWRLSLTQSASLDLLRAAYVEHADYLLWRGREPEAGVIARRAISIAEGRGQVDRNLMRAVFINGKAETDSNGRKSWRRGVEFLSRWVDVAEKVECLPTLYRDMAEYEGEGGRVETALQLVSESRDSICGGSDAAADSRLADTICARLLRKAGRAREALRNLHDNDEVSPGSRIFELLLAASVYADLQDSSAAEERLVKSIAMMDRYRFEHLRCHADRICARL